MRGGSVGSGCGEWTCFRVAFAGGRMADGLSGCGGAVARPGGVEPSASRSARLTPSVDDVEELFEVVDHGVRGHIRLGYGVVAHPDRSHAERRGTGDVVVQA